MTIQTRQELIKEYIEFFKSKQHKHIPSASLIPENDPTVLFTTAGMHPLVPYLLGQKHPLGKRLCSVQKCIRTQDIDEVGDSVHHTFFEMLGNWSLGDYFKEDAIKFSFEFLTKIIKIPKEKIAVTCFAGDADAEKDQDASYLWLDLGISGEKIAYLPKENNWWGPAGETGPCGPDTEMFYWKSHNSTPKKFNPDDDNWVEIWNDVFMQYNKTKSDKRTLLIDGMHCLYDDKFNLNQELLTVLSNINNKKIVVVNSNSEKAKEKLKGYDFDIFSLEKENIKKDNRKFFEELINRCHLNSSELIYFDHANENVSSAKELGINSVVYKNPKQIKEFIEEYNSVYVPLEQKNVDTGMGVERTLAILNGLEDNYLSSIFLPIIKEIETISGKKYKGNEKAMRIIADHLRAATFILGDVRGIKPSNVGQGYVLRRLIRRAIRYGKMLGINTQFISKVSKAVLPVYPDYQELHQNRKFIEEQLNEEESRFDQTLEKGIKKFEELAKENKNLITGKDAFLLFQSYGFPIEFTQELTEEKGIKVDLEEYNQEFERHQDLSRTASAGTFKSGLADNSDAVKKLHTATHLLNEALRKVLDKDIKQKGSNITSERLRFDFNFPRKLTTEEIKKLEDEVNRVIQLKLPVHREEIPLTDAIKSGAQSEFGAKYPELVSVYTIGDKNSFYSKEICTGPHVNNTSELGHFKITKEESVAAGIRRIKAICE